jgi:hypothetical protein
MLGEAASAAGLPAQAHQQLETRLAAMVIKRRLHLLMHWRRHERLRARSARPAPRRLKRPRLEPFGAIQVVCDLPALLPPVRAEVAILRALLGREIDQIIFGASE